MSDETTRVTLEPPPPPPPAPPEAGWPAQPPPRHGISAGTILLGGLLVLVGVLWLLQAADVVESPWGAVLPGALIAIGVAILIEARHGLHGGLVTLGIILTLALSVASLADVPLTGGVGDREHRPAAFAELDSPYELGIGEMTVDLSRVEFPAGETTVRVKQGIGDLTVILPEGVGAVVDWELGVGDITIFESFNQSGVGHDGVESRTGQRDATVRVRLSVGIGDVEVRYAR